MISVPRAARWYEQLSFARKLELFPRLAAAALGLVLLVSLAFGLVSERRLARLGDTYYPQVERAWRLEQTFAAVQRSLQDAAATDDADFIERADSLAGVFVENVDAGLASAPDMARARATRARIRRLFTSYYVVGRSLTVRLRRGEVGDSIAASLATFHARQVALRRALDGAARDDRTSIVEAIRAERTRQRVAWVAALGITLLCVVVLAILARITTRALTEPLARVVAVADRIADGDLRVTLPRDGHGEVGHLVRAMRRMVGNLRRSEQRLVHLAYHDPLTGLANRERFRRRLARAAASSEGRGSLAVLYIDLDDFKTVNDSLGHAAGDVLLRHVGDRLLGATRGCDTVARLGGDEFAVLLRGARGAADAVIVAERVSRALALPVSVHGIELQVSASIGIALGAEALGADLLDGADGGQAAEDLLRFADVAMYAAKHGGKGHHKLFEPGMHRRAQERRALEHDLATAVERNELVLYYQPIVELATGRVTGAEALVRWRHPSRGLVSPGDFIPLAEHTGLIVPIGQWVLQEACREAAHWLALGADNDDGRPLAIAVNISAAQLQHPGLIDEVRMALEAADLPASALTLEITETAMLVDPDAAAERLRELKALGVSIAVDDFGTGYSSLAYLQRFPVDVLKIDRSFVDAIGADETEPVLTRAIIALGGALGLRIVAEGIEQPAQVSTLRALGCVLGQGYHFARPLPATAFRTRFAATRACTAA